VSDRRATGSRPGAAQRDTGALEPAPRGHASDASAADRARDARPPVVDWHRTARRLRTVLAAIGVAVAVLWVAIGVARDGPSARLLAELAGLGLMGAFVVEVVVVGGAAVRGMLAAGERGDRLARGDVSLLPPQVGRRLRGGG